jgi:hypothetical protein
LKPFVDTVEIPNLRIAPTAIRKMPTPIDMAYLLGVALSKPSPLSRAHGSKRPNRPPSGAR